MSNTASKDKDKLRQKLMDAMPHMYGDCEECVADLDNVMELIERHTEQKLSKQEEDIFLGVGYGTGLGSILMSEGPDGLADFVIETENELRVKRRERFKLTRNTKEGQ